MSISDHRVAATRISAAALALLLNLAGPVAAQALDAKGSSDALRATPTLEGTWILTVSPPMGAPAFLATASYLRGGVLIVSPDRLPPVPGLGAVIGAGQGSWRATGPREFVSTHVEFRYGSVGEVVGTVKLRSALTVNGAGVLEGTGQLLLCGPLLDNCQPFGNLPATVTGVRLPVEAPALP